MKFLVSTSSAMESALKAENMRPEEPVFALKAPNGEYKAPWGLSQVPIAYSMPAWSGTEVPEGYQFVEIKAYVIFEEEYS